MPVGFQVFGDGGFIQVDGDWGNYALVQVQQILTVDTNWRALPARAAIHVGSQEGDLVFAHCDQYVQLLGVSFWDGARRVGVSVGTDNTNSPGVGALGIPVTFYVFRKQPPMASASGVQVFNAAGQLVFDAASSFAKVAGSIASSSSTAKLFLPAGRRYAVLLPSFSGQYIESYTNNPGPGPNFFWFIYANCLRVKCDSDGIQMNGMAIGAFTQIPSSQPGQNSTRNISGPPIIVADVTGYG